MYHGWVLGHTCPCEEHLPSCLSSWAFGYKRGVVLLHSQTLPASPEQKAVDGQHYSCQLLHSEWMHLLVQGLFVQTLWFCVAGDLAACIIPISLQKWGLLAETSRMTQRCSTWDCFGVVVWHWLSNVKAKWYWNGKQPPDYGWYPAGSLRQIWSSVMVSNAELKHMKIGRESKQSIFPSADLKA